MATRFSIPDFQLANRLYAGATVTVYTVSGGAKTSTKATLYDAATGSGTLQNPVTLDGEGKFSTVPYVDEDVVCTVSGLSIADHDTGIIGSPYLMPDGTVSAPGMAFEDDPDNGLYRISANRWGLSAAGTLRLSVGSNGDGALLEASAATAISGTRGATPTGANLTIDYSGGGRFHVPSGAAYAWDIAGSTIKKIDSSGNVLLGGTSSPASAAAALAIFNGTAPTGSVTNGVVLYAEDVSASSELKVRDEAGNVTTLSPHNFSLFEPDPNDPAPWSYYSRNEYLGKEINVDMSGAIRALESLTGQTFIHVRAFDKADWDAGQIAAAQTDREVAITKLMDSEIEVDAEEGLEIVAVFEPRPGAPVERFVLRDGGVVKAMVPTQVLVDTGRRVTRPKDGIRFDEETGKLYRKRTRDEAESEAGPLRPIKPPPAWLSRRVLPRGQQN